MSETKPANQGAGGAISKAIQRKATLLSVLTSPRAWMRFFKDKKAPLFPKVMAVLAFAYVVSPVDAVPEIAVPIAGFLDDLGVATFAATWLASVAAKYQNASIEGASAPADPSSTNG